MTFNNWLQNKLRDSWEFRLRFYYELWKQRFLIDVWDWVLDKPVWDWPDGPGSPTLLTRRTKRTVK